MLGGSSPQEDHLNTVSFAVSKACQELHVKLGSGRLSTALTESMKGLNVGLGEAAGPTGTRKAELISRCGDMAFRSPYA